MIQTAARRTRRALGISAALAAALAGAACATSTSTDTGQVTSANPYPTTAPAVTLQFWEGFSGTQETPVQQMVNNFEKLHPNIHIKVVDNITDAQIQQGIKSGKNGPDVALSFSTNDVGSYCSTGEWVNLSNYLKVSGVDMAKTFPGPLIKYTQYNGDQCSLPMENDAYGLYYNKNEFQAANLDPSSPPTTLAQLQSDAVALTKKNPDGSFAQLGFVPLIDYFEQTGEHFTQTFDLKWQNAQHQSVIAADPGFTQMLQWQQSIEQAILDKAPQSTFAQLTSFVNKAEAPGEFAAGQNPFETGAVAMQIDGEWRNANIQQETPSLSYGTVPFPTSDAGQYGGGYLSGTIVGISAKSKNQAADWEFLEYMTMNTQSLVTLANALFNVPSTFAALDSPQLTRLPQFQTFVKISGDANSAYSPSSTNGDEYLTTAETWIQNNWLVASPMSTAGLPSALQKLDSQIDSDTKIAGS
ncbi:MAG TPA: extracellular solute-binding protein [Actinocrinis sp.]